MTSSIVEAVITKDILTQARIKSPGLFRQCFYILSNYPAKIVSYHKILGQLQDKGNIDLVKYYVDLYESAFLIKPIYKFSKNEVRKKQSLPKFICMAPALSTFHRLDNLSPDYLGHVFESLVAAQLLKCGINLSYWSEGDFEVDLVLEYKNKVIAIEVKSGKSKKSISLDKFRKKYPEANVLFIDKGNYSKFEKDPMGFVEKVLF